VASLKSQREGGFVMMNARKTEAAEQFQGASAVEQKKK